MEWRHFEKYEIAYYCQKWHKPLLIRRLHLCFIFQDFLHIHECGICAKRTAWFSLREKFFYLGFLDLYFPIFWLSKEIYSVNIYIRSECRNIWARKTPNMDTLHTDHLSLSYWRYCFINNKWYKLFLWDGLTKECIKNYCQSEPLK